MARDMRRKLTRQEKLDKFRESEEVIAGLPIIRQTEKLMETLNHLVVEYPRYERYALGSQTRQAVQDFFELLVTAAKKYTKKKISPMEAAITSPQQNPCLTRFSSPAARFCAV